jgi:ketosteroid isomerase-like protein
VDSENIERLRSAWTAFSHGDVDAVADVLARDVRWYGAGAPDAEGACHNREQAMAFIRRSLDEGVRTDLVDLRAAGEHTVVAVVRPQRLPAAEDSAQAHGEVLTIRDGKVAEMVVYPTVGEALVAAGLDADT